MDRLLIVLGLCAVLMLAHAGRGEAAQPVFFSLLFPQLMPAQELDATPGEAVFV